MYCKAMHTSASVVLIIIIYLLVVVHRKAFNWTIIQQLLVDNYNWSTNVLRHN